MSTKGLRWDWERSFRAAPLASGPKLVGFVMATFGDADGEDIYPSTDRLADACGMNVKTARKYRDELVAAGWVECEHGSGGRGRANEYRLTVPETLPSGGRVKRAIAPPKPRETRPSEGRVSGSETRPCGARKPDHAAPVNPTMPWDPTRTDQNSDQTDAGAGPLEEPSSALGFEDVAEIAWHRRSADARDGDDAMQVSR